MALEPVVASVEGDRVARKEHEGTTWGQETFQSLTGVVVLQAYTFVKTHPTVRFRLVHLTVCKLFLDLKKVSVKESRWRKPLAFLSLVRKDFTKGDT